jgi:hypothetical protein
MSSRSSATQQSQAQEVRIITMRHGRWSSSQPESDRHELSHTTSSVDFVRTLVR